MRLIDADLLMQNLGFDDTEEERDENVGTIITWEDVDRMPTAYDVDKVVDMLEDFRDAELIDGTPAHGINEYKRICKCIEIVKSGAKQCEVD